MTVFPKFRLALGFLLSVICIPALSQTVSFSCGNLVKSDTLIITEHNQDQIFTIALKATDIAKPLDVQVKNISDGAAENGKDYQLTFSNGGKYQLKTENDFELQFELRLKADAFKESETEYFALTCTYTKISTNKPETKKLVIGIKDKAAETPVATTTTPQPAKSPTVKYLYNSYIICTDDKVAGQLELTLSAIEENSQIERMLITWSHVEKGNWNDTFVLVSNRTNFVSKAILLAKSKAFECTADSFQTKLEIAYDAAIAKIEKRRADIKAATVEGMIEKKIDSALNIFNSAIKNIADEQEDAAVIELQNNYILLRDSKKECVSSTGIQSKRKFDFSKSETTKKIEIDSVVIKVFNNQIYQVDIVSTSKQTITNNSWGIPLRSFIENRGETIFVYHDDKKFTLCYCELFYIRPSKNGTINYTIKDGTYTIFPPKDSSVAKKKIPISQKRLLDFFSASAFFDFLSIEKNNPNKNFFGEAFFRFNINNNNMKRVMITKELYTSVSISSNLFGGSDPGIKSIRDSQYFRMANGAIDSSTHSKSYIINYFDLYKNQFFQARPILNIVGIDLKSKSTYWEAINAGFHFLGSNATTIDRERGVDSVQTRTIFSVSPVIETRFKVNPKTNFGIDFHFSYLMGFALLNSEFQTLSGRENLTFLKREYDKKVATSNGQKFAQKKDMFIGELNFFFNPAKPKSNTNHGGFFFRINMAKPIDFSRMGHFMFLAGYSTDINTFMR